MGSNLRLPIFSLVLFLLVTVLTVQVRAEESGRQLYVQHCSQCHGLNGQGFRKLYPPLQGSDYFSDKQDALPCLIRKGIRGPIQLSGNRVHQTMPANPQLRPDQLAALIHYTSRFSAKKNPVAISGSRVNLLLQSCP